jgi:predicted TIM-barrel fold metal-dependent hydrolase
MYDGPIIDLDVHHNWKSQDDVMPYLPKGWQDYVTAPGPTVKQPMSVSMGFVNPHGFFREEGLLEDGSFPASDPVEVARRHLDASRITRAVLTHEDVLYLDALPNPFFAAEVARAANDWTADRWLPADSRFRASILVSNQLPDLAAAEIRRMSSVDRFDQVLMASNGIGKPFGHPSLDPIHRAAAEAGLPISFHVGAPGGIAASPIGFGYPNYYVEFHTLSCQSAMTHLVSLIAHGVFERYPALKVVLVETGSAWIPAILWRLDANYRARPSDTPWLKRPPSEYFRDHIRATTQPLETPEEIERLWHLLEAAGGEDVLCFASDYPHWDSDPVDFIEESLPQQWLPKVFHENACEVFGWSPDELEAEAATARGANTPA